jgi:inner membrane protein
MMGAAVAPKETMLGSARRDAILFVTLGLAADLDFIPGILMGHPSAFHHGPTHSVGAAMLVGLLMGLWGLKRGNPWRWGLVGFAVYFSHVLLDFIAADPVLPYGLMLWWPFSWDYYLASAPIFMSAQRHALTWAVAWHDIKALSLEIMLLGPPTAFMLWLRYRRSARQAQKLETA